MFDHLILGAGFAGSVLAERQTRIDRARLLLIDLRPHPAGNASDPCDNARILIPRFAPHVFLTNSDEVFEELSQFTIWRPNEHRVLASVAGELVPVPINVRTINTLFETNLTPVRATAFLAETAEPRERIETAEDVVVSKGGCRLYESLCRGYSRKPWIRDPALLPTQVTARIPANTSLGDRYFTGNHQAMLRDCYTAMFRRIIDHLNI